MVRRTRRNRGVAAARGDFISEDSGHRKQTNAKSHRWRMSENFTSPVSGVVVASIVVSDPALSGSP
jgi:hypothetical protein